MEVFNFALRVWGAYVCRGLDMEGLIFGILRYHLYHHHYYYYVIPVKVNSNYFSTI